MKKKELAAAIRRQVRAFERRIERMSKEQSNELRAHLREEKGVYFRRAYSVPAAFCKLPKRRRRR